MASSPGRSFSREQLLSAVWESSSDWQSPETVSEHVYRLRQKLGLGGGASADRDGARCRLPVRSVNDRIDYLRLFDATPTPYLILSAELRIIAVNDAYLNATMTRREQILGRGMFDVFPDNPGDPDATGVRNLGASLESALRTGEPDVMAIQRYDIRSPDGSFEQRYWSAINTPLLDEDGNVELIIHRVQDVTPVCGRAPSTVGPRASARSADRGPQGCRDRLSSVLSH